MRYITFKNCECLCCILETCKISYCDYTSKKEENYVGCFEKILDLGLAQTCWVRIFQGGTQESILGSGSQCAWHSSENVHCTWQGPLPVMSITESPVPAPQQEWNKCLLSPCADTSWCNCPDLSNCLFTMSSTVCLPQAPFCSLNKHTTHIHSAQSLLTLCSQSGSLLCLFGYRSCKFLVHALCGVCAQSCLTLWSHGL